MQYKCKDCEYFKQFYTSLLDGSRLCFVRTNEDSDVCESFKKKEIQE